MPLPLFPHTAVTSVAKWSNYSRTIADVPIPVLCTPGIAPIGNGGPGVLASHGESIRAILAHCFASPEPIGLRALGTTWSFSRLLEPAPVVVDPTNMTGMLFVPDDALTSEYKAEAQTSGAVPVFVQGGATIASINRRLAKHHLSLQTSGAGDGHRIAGCIATGTHGSAVQIGAVHDTVLGLYLVVGPDRAVLVQPAAAHFDGDACTQWLEGLTGMPTESVADDDAYATALVSLGSVGFVFGVILEAVPEYRLRHLVVPVAANEPRLWKVMETHDTSDFDATADPYHIEATLHPYPPSGTGAAYVTLMWKVDAGGQQQHLPDPAIPFASSDKIGRIGHLAAVFGGVGPFVAGFVQSEISKTLASSYPAGESAHFPAEIFGPTALPGGTGASTEVIVHHDDTRRALRLLYDVLAREDGNGRYLLGVIGVRFVPATRSLLGMNVAPMSCYIELPSIRNADVLAIYRAYWDALDDAQISFTCHWGQLNGLDAARVQRYFGARADRWRAARASLLGSTGARVFATPMLADVGLD